MSRVYEIRNAIISSTSLRIERGFFLDAWLLLDYGGGECQGFGGFALYIGKTEAHHTLQSVAGHFIYRCMEIAGVNSWNDIVGNTIRAKTTYDDVAGIGHIVKDDWFFPREDFKLEGEKK